MGADNAHGADPVRRYFGHQRVKNLQAGGVHHEDLRVVTVTQETTLTLGPNGELVELWWTGQKMEKESEIERRRKRKRDKSVVDLEVVAFSIAS